jgi:hypothetical protein
MPKVIPLDRGRDGAPQTYSEGVARWRYERARTALGDTHPRVRALLARARVLRAVPQRGATSLEAIAWYRASEAWPGYYNRAHRRELHRQRVIRAAKEKIT